MRKSAFIAAVAIMAAAVFLQGGRTAYAYDKLTVIGERGVYTFGAPEIVYYYAGTTMLRLDEIIDDIYQKEYVPAKDAYVDFSPDAEKKFKAVKEVYGKEIEKDKLKDDIISALSVGGGCVKATYKPVIPQITEKDLSTDIYVRSKFSTSYATSSEDRKSNVKKAAKTLNGVVVADGEQFSFNETVGKRSERNGYKNAKIIVDGNFVDGVGGGVCQVSTTLYNAALLSGLKISEYHPHSLAVSYVESSFDAMVSYGLCDLRFINNTGAPIYIKAFTADDRVYFVIYGKKLDCEYSRESVVTKITPAKIEKTFSSALDENEYIIKTAPKDGVESQGYLIKKINGKIVSRTLIRKDVYKPVTGLIEYGEKT